MGITTNDLAKICGVSRTTILRALNGNGRISPETKEMILRAAKENGYRPDLLARSLVNGKTYNIGVVVLDAKSRYFAEMISWIVNKANKKGYGVSIMLHGAQPKLEKKQLLRLASYRVDGIIVSSVNQGDSYMEFLKSLNTPIVSIDNKIADDIPFVGIEQKNAMKEITELAIDKGIKKIVFVCPPMCEESKENIYVHKERQQGVNEVIKKHADLSLVELLDWTYLEKVEELVEADKKVAFVCTADEFALPIIKRLNSKGKIPGKDYAITGFDNIDILDYISPKLTTVSNAVEEVANTAVNLLFDLMKEKESIGKDKLANEQSWFGNECRMLPYTIISGETL